jgi:CBS-domain-containing membrane protein
MMPLSWTFLLAPVTAGALLLVAVAFAYHRLTGEAWPRAWWAAAE